MDSSLSKLRNNIAKSFNLEEFKSICFDISEVYFDNLAGETLVGKIESLIEFLERRNRTDELIEICSKYRPNVNWKSSSSTKSNPDFKDMNSYVKLKLGDMFDGPSDLIVLPCSTGGSVTDFVAKYLLAKILYKQSKFYS